MSKKIRAFLLILLAAAVLPGCGKSALPQSAGAKEEAAQRFSGTIFDAFDTVITVTAYCRSQEEFGELMECAESEFMHWHRLCDIYFSCPDFANLRTVNDHAGVEPVAVPDELIGFLTFAKDMYAFTDGRMNIAMGSVLRLWHDIREYNNAFPDDIRLPDGEALKAASAHSSIDDLIIDREAGTVFLRDGEMSLDVGAVAKGYATERVAEKLAAMGCESFALNAGGNVRVGGAKPNGSAWVIAVTDPDLSSGERALGSVEVKNCSVVTSGSYQRFFDYEGRRYHHIIDGETLLPENRYLSVTVITRDSALADALSTALFNMEPEEGYAFVQSLDGVEAMWVLADGSEVVSPGFVLKK